MKIVIAVDSFKGSLSSRDIGDIFAKVARERFPDIEVVVAEIADGGEGSLEAVIASGKFEPRYVDCVNPLMEKINAPYGVAGKTAFIEMAKASGLTLIPYAKGNAAITTTYGTGLQMLDAVKRGAEEVIVAVGGSATNDGGTGAISAFGYEFLDEEGRELTNIGLTLGKIAKVDDAEATDVKGVKFTVLTDVDNPLVGPTGATYFFGKQKGAEGEIADCLEAGMINYAEVIERYNGVKLKDMPGAGAAGGLAGGLHAIFGAEIRSGIDAILDLISFDDMLIGASAVITGEGRLDDQSAHGKAISGVCARTRKAGVPVYAIVGASSISAEQRAALGIEDVKELSALATSTADSIANAAVYAEKQALALISMISR